MAFRKFFALTSLACSSLAAQAIHIAAPQGTPWIGRPIELTAMMSMDIGQGWDSACLQAEMLQGNAAGAAIALQVAPLGPAQGGQQRVRLWSQTPVEAPWLEIRIRTGCAQPQWSMHTLLAELPPTPPLPVSVAEAVPLAPVLAVAPVPEAQKPQPVARSVPAKEPVREKAASPSASAGRPARAPETAPAPVAVKPAPTARAASATAAAPVVSRLELEPLSAMLTEAAAVASSAATANPSVVQGASHQPLDTAAPTSAPIPAGSVVTEAERAERIAKLEAELTQWRAQARQESRRAQALQQQLDAKQTVDGVTTWLWAFVAALLAIIVGMGLRLRRQHDQGGKRHARSTLQSSAAPTEFGPEEVVKQKVADAVAPPAPQASMSSAANEGALPIHVLAPDVEVQSVPGRSPAAAALDDALVTLLPRELLGNNLHPVTAPVEGLLNAELVQELQQQVEFLTSIGENDQALDLLEQQLLVHGRCAPALHLEKLKILHSLIRTEVFEQARQVMMRYFRVQVPEFVQFSTAQGEGVLGLPQVLGPIMRSWGKPQVSSLIEAQLLRSSEASASQEDLPLSAFEDLLLLHVLCTSQTQEAAA